MPPDLLDELLGLLASQDDVPRDRLKVARFLGVASAQPAIAQRIRAELLTCDVSAGLGLIVTAQKQLSCDSRRVDPALCMRTMAARYSRTLTVPPRSTLT